MVNLNTYSESIWYDCQRCSFLIIFNAAVCSTRFSPWNFSIQLPQKCVVLFVSLKVNSKHVRRSFFYQLQIFSNFADRTILWCSEINLVAEKTLYLYFKSICFPSIKARCCHCTLRQCLEIFAVAAIVSVATTLAVVVFPF